VTVPAGTTELIFTLSGNAPVVLSAGVVITNFGISITNGAGPATPQTQYSGNTVVPTNPLLGAGLILSLYYYGTNALSASTPSFTIAIQSVQVA
jgi:hypothetical protein